MKIFRAASIHQLSRPCCTEPSVTGSVCSLSSSSTSLGISMPSCSQSIHTSSVMGEVDVERQRPNVFWMEQLGAEVIPVKDGTRILKDAINEAFRDWVSNMDNTHYVLGTACGPHPFPEMVVWFQSIIGQEARAQVLEREGKLPRSIYACVGGGSNAIGLFHRFLDDKKVQMVGVEAGGESIASGRHAARFADPQRAQVGVLHGTRSYVLQNADGQILETHSISAGLDYPAVGPEHALLRDQGRVNYTYATDDEALAAVHGLVLVRDRRARR